MQKCKWCGRSFKDGTGVSDGLLGYGSYCSERCRQEDRAARKEGGGSKKGTWKVILVILFFLIIYLISK